MEPISLCPVSTPEGVEAIAALGAEIWQEHYLPLLGPEQVAYMVEKFQSVSAVSEQLRSGGYCYWLILWEGAACGYCGFVKEPERLFLSKLYLKKEFRGRGISRFVLEALKKEAKGRRSIYLTVNKYNASSIAVYEKLGFCRIDAVKTPIGGGFYMDDYIMELPLQPESAL